MVAALDRVGFYEMFSIEESEFGWILYWQGSAMVDLHSTQQEAIDHREEMIDQMLGLN